MNLRLNANAIITNSEGKLLLIKLKKGPFKGGFSIPGGGINPGELCQSAVMREVLEETGITLESQVTPVGFCELVHEGVQDHKVILLLHSVSNSMPKETEDAIGVWLSYEEAEGKLIPFAKEAIRMWNEKRCYFKLVGDETGITRKYE